MWTYCLPARAAHDQYRGIGCFRGLKLPHLTDLPGEFQVQIDAGGDRRADVGELPPHIPQQLSASARNNYCSGKASIWMTIVLQGVQGPRLTQSMHH